MEASYLESGIEMWLAVLYALRRFVTMAGGGTLHSCTMAILPATVVQLTLTQLFGLFLSLCLSILCGYILFYGSQTQIRKLNWTEWTLCGFWKILYVRDCYMLMNTCYRLSWTSGDIVVNSFRAGFYPSWHISSNWNTLTVKGWQDTFLTLMPNTI